MADIGETNASWRDRALAFGATGLCTLLFAVIMWRAWGEAGGSNAYALIAESFLNRTPDVSACFGKDCAFLNGKTYIVFPPFPALFAMPLVWLKGVNATGFIAISIALWAASLAVWNRIARHLEVGRSGRFWLLAAIGFASPLFYVTLRGEGVWFFAQSSAFFFVTLAIHEAMAGRRLFTAGLALGAALLSRQMSVFYGPLLLLIWFRAGEPVLLINRERIAGVIRLGIPVFVALSCYFAYNYWRFGDPLETGYRFITLDSELLKSRMDAYGLWNKAYVVFNFFYFFLQGFHADFAAPQQVALTGLDPAGTSFLAASPWLLLVFFARCEPRTLVTIAMMAGFTGLLLFYHSNGFSQYNTQRYALDWLPAALLVMAPALTAQRLEWFRLLVVWGIALNVAMVVVLAITKSG